MTNIIIACDNEDTQLGIFFNKCADVLKDSISEDWNCVLVNSKMLNEYYLEFTTDQFNGNFIFASFTHGSESSLVSAGSAFLQCPVKPNFLINSFSYCFACHSGKLLGRELVEKGTHAFIGYSDQVTFVVGYLDIFSACAIEGLISFKNGANISESLQMKKSKHNKEIDSLYRTDFVAASVLMDNRDCLILHGNGSLGKLDFNL